MLSKTRPESVQMAQGCLTIEGDIDQAQTRELIELARPMSVTFHRAFDMCRDAKKGLEDLVALGVDRVLTSGQDDSCLEGMELIAALERQAKGRIIVMPGGGITPRNVSRIVAGTGVREVHLSARVSVESRMTHRNSHCFMGGTMRPPEFSWKATDESVVRDVVDRLRRGG